MQRRHHRLIDEAEFVRVTSGSTAAIRRRTDATLRRRRRVDVVPMDGP